MRAFVLTGGGAGRDSSMKKIGPSHQLAPTIALIRVLACGLNNTDINTRIGWYSKSVTEATTGEAANVKLQNPTWGGSHWNFRVFKAPMSVESLWQWVQGGCLVTRQKSHYRQLVA